MVAQQIIIAVTPAVGVCLEGYWSAILVEGPATVLSTSSSGLMVASFFGAPTFS